MKNTESSAVRSGHRTKKLDLTGQRFGKLVVLGPAKNISSCTAWRCRCDCGRETVVMTKRLRDGHRTSCGCDRETAAVGLASLTYVDGTCVEMIRTKTVRRNNTSGVPGVDWMMKKQRWRATICFKGTRHYLGSYKNYEDAVKARKMGEEKYHNSFVRQFEEEPDSAAPV